VNQIIKCLIPRNGVTADCVVDLISKMCANKISVNIQVIIYQIYCFFHVPCKYGKVLEFEKLNPGLCNYVPNTMPEDFIFVEPIFE
jgi:hypothetical protein